MSVQGNDDWHKARLGKLTGSVMFKVINTTKTGGYTSERANLMHDLAIATITGKPTETVTTAAMANGTRQEPIARTTYELVKDVSVKEIMFIDHPKLRKCGFSPDGLVNDDGLIEIKSPLPKTHLEYMETGIIPPPYYTQIHWGFACMPERRWADFISFCDAMPHELRIYIKRVNRDDTYVHKLEREAVKFIEELDALIENLRGKIEAAVA